MGNQLNEGYDLIRSQRRQCLLLLFCCRGPGVTHVNFCCFVSRVVNVAKSICQARALLKHGSLCLRFSHETAVNYHRSTFTACRISLQRRCPAQDPSLESFRTHQIVSVSACVWAKVAKTSCMRRAKSSQLDHRAVSRAGRMSQNSSSLSESQQMSPAQKALKSRASTVGQALMFVAALFWGSNPAALRYLYTSPGPPDAPVLSAAQTGLASVILIIISQCMKAARARRKAAPSREQDPPPMRTSDSDTQELIAHNMPSDFHEDELESAKALKQGDEPSSPKVSDIAVIRKGLLPLDHLEVAATQVALASVEDSKAPSTPDNDIEAAMGHSLSLSIESSASDTPKTGIRYQIARLLNWSTDDVRIAGLELGLLTFTANAVTIVGFALATASRGAFLLRSSIVSTPILSTLAGISVAKAMWMGAVLGFTGSVLISTDPVDDVPAPADTDSYISHVSILGDLLIVCAAVLWSGVMVRQSRHAACFPATDLAAAKLSVMACMSFLWLLADVLYKIAIGKAVVSIWAGWHNPVAWLVLLWPAIGPWSTAEIAQIEAQSRISASHGQIILAIDPLISVAFAGLVNKAEQHLGIRGWFGGALLVIACLVASRGDSMPMH